MRALKLVRIAAWGAVVVVGGLLIGFSGLLPNGQQRSAVEGVTGSGTVTIGGPFELTTHNGQTFTNAHVAGKPYLVFFGFTYCPDICPTTLSELTSLIKELGSDADLFTPLFITVDPERDSQQILSEYMKAFDSRIIALRGTPEQTVAAAKAFRGYYKKVPLEGGDYTMDHTAGVLLMNAESEFVGTLDMHEPRANRIAKLRRFIRSKA